MSELMDRIRTLPVIRDVVKVRRQMEYNNKLLNSIRKTLVHENPDLVLLEIRKSELVGGE